MRFGPREWSVRAVSVDGKGRLVVAAQADVRITLAAPDFRSTVFRLQPDGTPDPTFTPLTWNASEIRDATVASGAFPFARSSADAALLATLLPGNYTALVEGAAGEAGVTLVEVYEAP